MVLLMLLATVGNLLVCTAVIVDRRLRTIPNVFIVSLAVSDLLVALLGMPLSMYNDIGQHWELGEVFCAVWLGIDFSVCLASIFNLYIISLHRYLQIVHGMWYKSWVTKTKARVFILVSWLSSVLVIFAALISGVLKPYRTDQNVLGNDCLPGFFSSPTLGVLVVVVVYCIPCIVMIYFYLCIYRLAKAHAKNIHRTRRPSLWSSKSNRSLMSRRDSGKSKKLQSFSVSCRKTALSLGALLGAMILCWTPFFVVIVVFLVCKLCASAAVYHVTCWMAYANSSINPIIYSVLNTGNFRQTMSNLMFHKPISSRRSPTVSPRFKVVTVYDGTSKRMSIESVTVADLH